ncbi:MAG: polyphosphate kinase 1 [bacterium]|nr:polyphosphate kinase 1 [bacterium]
MSEETVSPKIQLNPENFTNRELSALEFNRRVLALAEEADVPLLERVKFLAIVASNLDEFFMVRVPSYHEKIKRGISTTRPDGYTPIQLLAEIHRQVHDILQRQRGAVQQTLLELEQHNIFIRRVEELPSHLREAVRAYFYEEIFPVLTPLAADHARPFPFISNLSLNLGVYVISEEHDRDGHYDPDDTDFVRIKVPEDMARLVSLDTVGNKYSTCYDCQDSFVWIEDLIADNLDLLFPGMKVLEVHPFRVVRDADIDYEHEIDAEELDDISEIIQAGLRGRKFGSVTRLSVPESISQRMLDRLIYELEVEKDRDVYVVGGALGSSALFQLYDLDRPALKYPAFVPRLADNLDLSEPGVLFDAIRERDILMHHPYESFLPVEEFFRLAARDPQVVAIKATLYRVGKNSPIVRALMEARDNDKQVAVLVELKARFDEENNLEWARSLEERGVHVTYGVEKLPVKTHAKIAMVVRKEGDGLRRYIHLGTGNYNASTARLYTDLGLLTDDKEIAEDATRLFNRLTGFAPRTTYKRLLVAPEYLHPTLVALVENEMRAAQAGKPARLIFKMNQLEEDVLIEKMYEASNAGVQIDLIIRGLCCLRPGIPGVSENIRVRSIIGRFLEHTRIYYFQNAPENQRLYAGSADLMRRNLYNRVETVFPILDPRLQRRVMRILATDLRSNHTTWALKPDGTYARIERGEDEPLIDSQMAYMQDSAGLDLMP